MTLTRTDHFNRKVAYPEPPQDPLDNRAVAPVKGARALTQEQIQRRAEKSRKRFASNAANPQAGNIVFDKDSFGITQ